LTVDPASTLSLEEVERLSLSEPASESASHPTSFVDLERGQQERQLLRTLVRSFTFFALIIAVFYLLPLEKSSSAWDSVWRLTVGSIAFLAMMYIQFRRITRAQFPALRAVEALAVAIPLFLIVYAITYVSLSNFGHNNFNQPLTHTSGLYFSVVTFGTVGYGDIVPTSNLARLLVCSQILGDLIFVAAGFRVLAAAAQLTLKKKGVKPLGN
jgi:voltage-gated potassium channel